MSVSTPGAELDALGLHAFERLDEAHRSHRPSDHRRRAVLAPPVFGVHVFRKSLLPVDCARDMGHLPSMRNDKASPCTDHGAAPAGACVMRRSNAAEEDAFLHAEARGARRAGRGVHRLPCRPPPAVGQRPAHAGRRARGADGARRPQRLDWLVVEAARLLQRRASPRPAQHCRRRSPDCAARQVCRRAPCHVAAWPVTSGTTKPLGWQGVDTTNGCCPFCLGTHRQHRHRGDRSTRHRRRMTPWPSAAVRPGRAMALADSGSSSACGPCRGRRRRGVCEPLPAVPAAAGPGRKPARQTPVRRAARPLEPARRVRDGQPAAVVRRTARAGTGSAPGVRPPHPSTS